MPLAVAKMKPRVAAGSNRTGSRNTGSQNVAGNIAFLEGGILQASQVPEKGDIKGLAGSGVDWRLTGWWLAAVGESLLLKFTNKS